MPNVKEMSGSQAAASTTAAATVLDARIAKKTTEMQAGQVIVEATAKQMTQMKEELDKERNEGGGTGA